MNNIAGFRVDQKKCIGCGACVKVCPGGLLSLDEHRKPCITGADSFGWNGCWKCEHYMETEQVMHTLIANRHSCRRYQNRAVDSAVIEDMLCRLGNAPNGGNKQQVEFTLIDDVEQMNEFRNLAYKEMERLAENGVYPEGFDKKTYEDMKRWEQSVRPEKKKLRSKKVL